MKTLPPNVSHQRRSEAELVDVFVGGLHFYTMPLTAQARAANGIDPSSFTGNRPINASLSSCRSESLISRHRWELPLTTQKGLPIIVKVNEVGRYQSARFQSR
ncbi:MAG: hypothetical protein H6631_18520 [Anaerolineaceae bacterium]|nr:hypothetical protein [Anaerolineaceae bacterium]